MTKALRAVRVPPGTTVAQVGLRCNGCGALYFSKGKVMLRYAVVFLIIALIAGALGMFHVEWMASQIAWILFVVFLILFVVSLVMGRRGPPAE